MILDIAKYVNVSCIQFDNQTPRSTMTKDIKQTEEAFRTLCEDHTGIDDGVYPLDSFTE